MRKSLLLITPLVLFFIQTNAQKPFTKEIGIYSDNDSYTSLYNDGYYTNGLTFFYKFMPEKKSTAYIKKIVEYKLGIKMYTPRKGTAPKLIDQDRPFAGYLFVGGSLNYFFENESYLKIGASVGIIGPSSGGGDIQNAFHKIFGLYEIFGWEYQIQDMLALNTKLFFSKKLFNLPGKCFDYHAIVDANIGTAFTNIGFGLLNRLSVYPANKIYRSGIYGSLIDQTPLKKSLRIPEFFLFVKPMIYYRAYDATIQGSMFNDNSPHTFDIKPRIFSIEAGVIFQLYRVNLKYSVTFNSIEVLNDKIWPQTYGSLDISYIF